MFQDLRLGLQMLLKDPGFSVVITSFVLLFISPVIGVSTAYAEPISQSAGSQTPVTLTQFSSIELHDGVKAILRHGPVQRVTLLKGTTDYSQIAIANLDRLVINKCRSKCPRGYELEVEIVVPYIAEISVADGGTIEGRGSFPRQAEIRVDVSQGGTIDIRSLTVDSVIASVHQGGRIFTKPQSAMLASIRQRGNITYWGDAQVLSSVKLGGDVTKGKAEDANKPLSDFGAESVPPIPPLPAIQPVGNLFR